VLQKMMMKNCSSLSSFCVGMVQKTTMSICATHCLFWVHCCEKGFDMQYLHHLEKMAGCNTLIMLTLNMLFYFIFDFFVDLVPNLNLAPPDVVPPM